MFRKNLSIEGYVYNDCKEIKYLFKRLLTRFESVMSLKNKSICLTYYFVIPMKVGNLFSH